MLQRILHTYRTQVIPKLEGNMYIKSNPSRYWSKYGDDEFTETTWRRHYVSERNEKVVFVFQLSDIQSNGPVDILISIEGEFVGESNFRLILESQSTTKGHVRLLQSGNVFFEVILP